MCVAAWTHKCMGTKAGAMLKLLLFTWTLLTTTDESYVGVTSPLPRPQHTVDSLRKGEISASLIKVQHNLLSKIHYLLQNRIRDQWVVISLRVIKNQHNLEKLVITNEKTRRAHMRPDRCRLPLHLRADEDRWQQYLTKIYAEWKSDF